MREMVWQPTLDRIAAANISEFTRRAETATGRTFAAYDELHRWSVTDPGAFWSLLADYFGVRMTPPAAPILRGGGDMLTARWFAGCRLNFAENLLAGAAPEAIALDFRNETGACRRVSYAELRAATGTLAAALRRAGVSAGDCVAGYLPNIVETVIAMLATTSIGAVWSSASPDFGTQSVVDRFGQIRPKVLFAADGYVYRGTEIDCLDRLAEVAAAIPSIELVVVVPYLRPSPDLSGVPRAILWTELTAATRDERLVFAELPFDHPVYVLYSSGTTGAPKCIVHGAGGSLLQHLKEHRLHVDLKLGDRIFYYTTCGWMMWNWLVSGLASGATVVLFDGAPFSPDPAVLWRMAEELKVTVFGTSAKYLAALEKAGLRPREQHDLSALRAILSTGSPLTEASFRYVYRDIKSDVLLASISGGTDIISCFVLGNPTLPVFAGEIQCRGLGMDVHAFDEEGRSVIGQKGELVCATPFPSQPVGFWNDPAGEKYRSAYFDRFPGVWCHGDFVEITERGSVIIYGRSDATLNPGGVRIGTAEIYRAVEPLAEIADSLVVGRDQDGDVQIVLFVKLAAGCELSASLAARIRQAIRAAASPRHVPAQILAVPDIPYTVSGKKVEIAVKRALQGLPVTNRNALANPEALRYFEQLRLDASTET